MSFFCRMSFIFLCPRFVKEFIYHNHNINPIDFQLATSRLYKHQVPTILPVVVLNVPMDIVQKCRATSRGLVKADKVCTPTRFHSIVDPTFPSTDYNDRSRSFQPHLQSRNVRAQLNETNKFFR
jgi:hypothetical protein